MTTPKKDTFEAKPPRQTIESFTTEMLAEDQKNLTKITPETWDELRARYDIDPHSKSNIVNKYWLFERTEEHPAGAPRWALLTNSMVEAAPVKQALEILLEHSKELTMEAWGDRTAALIKEREMCEAVLRKALGLEMNRILAITEADD